MLTQRGIEREKVERVAWKIFLSLIGSTSHSNDLDKIPPFKKLEFGDMEALILLKLTSIDIQYPKRSGSADT